MSLTAQDYEDVLADQRRLVRELDVALNGKAGAAPQASLCDLLGQVADASRYFGRPILLSLKGCKAHDPDVVAMAWDQAVREFMEMQTDKDFADRALGACLFMFERALEIEALAYATEQERAS